MGWLSRDGRASELHDQESEEILEEPIERSAPGAAAAFGSLEEGSPHSVLDLGPAADSSLRVYGRHARWIRFADLLSARSRDGLASALDAVPPQPDRPYDLVFAWNVLDRLSRAERSRLMDRLVQVTAPGARLHLVVRASENEAEARPLRFALLDDDRMRCRPTGPPRPTRRRLLPAEVEDLLSPFHVLRGFTLRGGLREYVAGRERPPRAVDREQR